MQFTAPDLAAIAQSFDTLERDALGGEERASTNMDDSGAYGGDTYQKGAHLRTSAGFFSIQVIEKALEVWGLRSSLSLSVLNIYPKCILASFAGGASKCDPSMLPLSEWP